MGFFGARSAGLNSPHFQTRLDALNNIDDSKQDRLADIALNDSDARVRIAAVHRVSDNRRLQELLKSSDTEVQRVAKERLAGVSVKIVLGQSLDRCQDLLATINEQKSLAELTLSATDVAVRAAALNRLLAQAEPSPALLVMIAVQDATGTLAKRAIERIDRKGLLKDVARKAKNSDISKLAEARAALLTENLNKPSTEKLRKARLVALEEIIPSTLRLAVMADTDRATSEWTLLEAKRDGILTQFSEAPLDDAAKTFIERIAKAKADFHARIVAERERIAAVTATRTDFIARLDARPAVTEGDTTEERAALTAAWKILGELPVSTQQELDARLRTSLARLFPAVVFTATPTTVAIDPIEQMDPAARAELEQLSLDSEHLATSTQWRDAQDRFRLLHKRWNQLSAALPKGHPLAARFLNAYDQFKSNQKAWKSDKREQSTVRLAELEKLAHEAEMLARQIPVNELDSKVHFERIRELQIRWKQVGPLRPDVVHVVRERFRTAIDLAFEPVRKLREAEDWGRFQYLAKAEELTAEVEALASVEDFATIAKAVKDAQARWKANGPLPGDRRESAWQRFRTACDAQFTRCQPYFAELDSQRQDNLLKKRALIEELERLVANSDQTVGLTDSPADHSSKRGTAERIKAIQAEWRVIGPVPRENDKETWDRFRTTCDRFFTQHKGDINARHQEQQQNLNLKLALCVEAEDLAKELEAAIAAGDESKAMPPHERLKNVKELQASWKNIGYVPRDNVEATWTRFRTACDRVYATCQAHLASQEAERQANLVKKNTLLDEVEELLKHENARWFKDDFLDLQRQFREIGYIPREAMDTMGARSKDVFSRMQTVMQQEAPPA